MTTIRVFLALIATPAALLLAAPIIILGLPFWTVALVTRALLPLCQPRIVPWQELIKFHPVLGWKAKPDLDAHCLEEREDVFHVRTDPQGWPGRTSVRESSVVVFGDSYAFGYGVDERASFWRANPRLPVKSIGAPGYNLVQGVLLMRHFAPELRGKLVVWFIYLGNDLYDNLSPEMSGYRTPFVRKANGDESWEIVTHHLSPAKWSCSLGRQGSFRRHIATALFSDSLLAERAYSACEFLIRQGRDICRHAGAEIVVMTIPSPGLVDGYQDQPTASQRGSGPALDRDFPDRRIGEICDTLRVTLVPLRSHLDRRHYKEWDDHWNERGHQRVAQLLWDVYRGHLARQSP